MKGVQVLDEGSRFPVCRDEQGWLRVQTEFVRFYCLTWSQPLFLLNCKPTNRQAGRTKLGSLS